MIKEYYEFEWESPRLSSAPFSLVREIKKCDVSGGAFILFSEHIAHIDGDCL